MRVRGHQANTLVKATGLLCPPERRQKLAQLLVRKAAAVESINQEHRAYFFRRQAGEPMVISNERMREMLDELFD